MWPLPCPLGRDYYNGDTDQFPGCSRQADTEARTDFLKGKVIKGDNGSSRVPGLPRKEIFFYTSWSLQMAQKRYRLEMGQEQMATQCVAMTVDRFERPQQAGTVPYQTFLGSSRAVTTNKNETCPRPPPKAFETLSPSTVVRTPGHLNSKRRQAQILVLSTPLGIVF